MEYLRFQVRYPSSPSILVRGNGFETFQYFRRRQAVRNKALAGLKLLNGLAGFSAGDAVFRSWTVSQSRQSPLDVGDPSSRRTGIVAGLPRSCCRRWNLCLEGAVAAAVADVSGLNPAPGRRLCAKPNDDQVLSRAARLTRTLKSEFEPNATAEVVGRLDEVGAMAAIEIGHESVDILRLAPRKGLLEKLRQRIEKETLPPATADPYVGFGIVLNERTGAFEEPFYPSLKTGRVRWRQRPDRRANGRPFDDEIASRRRRRVGKEGEGSAQNDD